VSESRIVQSAVFLPLSAQLADPETITWCRGVPLLMAEELQAASLARACFAAWTSGEGASFRLVHLQTAPPEGHVSAYARAARTRLGASGWGSWYGEPFMRWLLVPASGGTPRKVSVEAPAGADRLAVVRASYDAVRRALGLSTDRPPVVLSATESDGALLAWLQDLESHWTRRRRGDAKPSDRDYRFLLSALTQDPSFEPAARRVLRRAGLALAGNDPGRAARSQAIEALETLLRLRPQDPMAWTLLGMLQRSLGRDEAAITSLRKAVKVGPESVAAHRELGSLWLRRRDLRKAGAHLRKAGKLSPRDPDTHMALGSMYLQLKDRTRAISHLRAVLKLAPGTATASTASRLLRDVDEGPVRTATNALSDVMPDTLDRDRSLIARTFGVNLETNDDVTSPGPGFMERLGDETERLD
jgi:Flp pilus assembly protein TadD